MYRFGFIILFALGAALPAEAQTFDYTCDVGSIQILLHVDVDARSVTQQVHSGSIVLTAEYMDGVFGKVSERGMGTLIPAMHQFVQIDKDKVSYGGQLDGSRDTAVLDRRTSILTLANGKAGWCSIISSSQK